MLDRLLALLAIIGSAPFLLAISIYVYCFISRGIIFAQMRPGFEQRLFRLYKFKTMTDECDADGSLLPDDERLSKYGQFLRRTSLDELPEFFNIVMGEMRSKIIRAVQEFNAWGHRRHFLNSQPPIIPNFHKIVMKMQQTHTSKTNHRVFIKIVKKSEAFTENLMLK